VLAQTVQENNIPLFFEKAYLHTDRDIYGQGEDIWYKAYVVNAQSNIPINYSHNLYVELISPEAKLIRREIIRLENGLGNGDFKLSETIPAGKYRIRAYTNWMRNFGDNFVFEKEIMILETANAPAAAAIAKSKKITATVSRNSTNASSTATPAIPTIRFYPEGGSLVNGINSFVGVKAEDANGEGIPTKGYVISSSGDTVSHFSCDSLGIGLLVMVPITNQNYHAVADKIGSFELPKALSQGLTLQIKQSDSLIHVIINRPGQPLSGTVGLAIRHAGKTQLNKRLQLLNQQTVAIIPITALPEGISAITLYNEQGKPECERLVYIHHPETKDTISISSNKKSYQPKEQVTLTIHAQPNSSLSLSVVDADAIPVQAGNIVSYFQLQSEIKGNIESPNRYFDTTNINRAKQLNMLLLTQGWRNFVWRRMEDTTLRITYQPQQGIDITGKVRKVWAKTGLSEINITMRAPNVKGQKLFWALTDSSGRFTIYDTEFYGYQYISFTSRRSDKINKDGESKGNKSGWLQVDSLWQDTLAINLTRINKPNNAASVNQQTQVNIERLIKNLGLKAGHNLKEVTIKGTKSRLFTRLPTTKHPITMVEQKEYDNLAQYLLYMVPGSSLKFDGCTYCSPGGGRPDARNLYIGTAKIIIGGVYIDNSKINSCFVCQDDYLSLPMSSILKVNIFSAEDITGLHVSVQIALRPGALDTKDYFDNTVADMVGYYKAREFYKPKFEKPDDIDLRTNTIHWEPNIVTNSNGAATITYYNTSQQGKVRLIVEGLTSNGTPLVATANYEVK